jgi:Zn-finger nucleic acid-binding protein
MFEGSAYCPQCGAARSRQESSTVAGTCPGCNGDLEKVAVGKTSLFECASCDGAWVDAQAFEALCADGEAQAAVLHRYANRAAVGRTAVKYRRCLRCQKMMNRVNFGRLSGTIVDVCRGHGTYLDAGELHQIVTFIRGGGMERARQHQLDELKTEQQRLQALEMRVRAREAMHSGGSGWNDHSFLQFITMLDIRGGE